MPGDRDLLRRVDSGREWNSQKATRKPWRRSNPTVRKYYRLEGEEDVDPWEGNILEQPPGALPRSLRTSASAWTLSSPTPSEFSTRPTSPISPLQGQRSEVVFPGTAPAIGGGATAVPLSKPPPLQLGDLHARMSSRRTLGVEAPLSTSARRHHGVRNQSMLEAMKGLDREEAEDKTPAQEDDTEEESRRTEANAPLWTTRIAAEDDPFETTLKLAGIEKMKRRELRRMKELSADALARLTGFRQSDLRQLGGEDASPLERFQQEAEAKYGLQSSHYRDLLTSYRHKAYEAQMGARRETLKPLLPVRKRFFKTPSKLKDELAYLETLTDGDDVASDFLFVRRAKGWNLNAVMGELSEKRLLTPAVQREPTTSSTGDYGEENGSDKEQSEKGSDDRDCDIDDGEESSDSGEHGIRAAPSSAGVTFEEPEAVELMPGDMSGVSLSLEEEGEDDKAMTTAIATELPSIWDTMSSAPVVPAGAPSAAAMALRQTRIPSPFFSGAATCREGAASPPRGRLAPVMLLQVPAIGAKLLNQNLRRLLTGQEAPVPPAELRTDMEWRVTGLEELILSEANRVPGWEQGPQERGTFEKQVARLTGGRKEGTTIRNKILSVLTLAQLARRTVMEPNFPEEGNCVMHLSNANLTAYDLPGLLHVASWSLDKVAEVGGVTSAPESAQTAAPRSAVGRSASRMLMSMRTMAARKMAAVATRDDADLAADETDNSDAHSPLVGPENSREALEGLVSEYSFNQCSPLSNVVTDELECDWVTKLVLSGNKLDDDAAAVLSLGLRELRHISHLDLSDNPMTWRAAGALSELLSPPLKEHPRLVLRGPGALELEHLDLSRNPIGDKGLALLAEPLKQNRTLRRLYLNYCEVTQVGAHHLGWMLNENRSLAELRLGWNRLFHKGAAELALGMRSSLNLTRLDVQSNGLGDRGAAYLANALLDNRSVTHLNLSRNAIAAPGCLVLAEALTGNTHLGALMLHDNPLGAEGGSHLLLALSTNTTVHHLGLQGCCFVDTPTLPDPGGAPQQTFNRHNPAGPYKLALNDPTNRQIAVELYRLREQQGDKSWSEVKLNGKPVKSKDMAGWPAQIPEEGTLELRFDAVMAPPEDAEAMGAAAFANICQEMRSGGANDQWRLSLLHVICGTHYFTSAQGDVLARAFSWSLDRVQACVVLFGRILDPHKFDVFTASLNKECKKQLHTQLGMLAFFRPENPTAHYCLNLSRQLDRVIAARLLVMSGQEGLWRQQPIMANFRNVMLGGQPVKIDPDRYQLPPEGIITFDYITYTRGTVLEGKKKNAMHRRLYPQLSPLQFSAILKSLEVLRVVELEAVERSRARRQREARIAERGAETDAAMRQWKRAGAAGRAPAQRLQLDLKKREVVEAGLALDVEDDEAELGTDMDSARVRPTSVMELFRELEAQEDARELAAQLAARAKGAAAGEDAGKERDESEAGADGAEVRKVRVEWAGRRRWEATMAKVKGVRGMREGLAEVLEDDIPNCTALELLRSFAGHKYVTCKQVLMILEIFNFQSITNGSPAQQRVNIVQVLFTRLADTVHFGDVLRSLDRDTQLTLNRRLGYHNTILTGIREDNSHLNKLYFHLRLSVEDEYLCGKRLAEYVVKIPNQPGIEGGPFPIFRNLHVNGGLVAVAEDKQFWKTLTMLGKERKKPDASWDPAGTLEFQLVFPERWMRCVCSQKIQSAFRTFQRRRDILAQIRIDASTGAAPPKSPTPTATRRKGRS